LAFCSASCLAARWSGVSEGEGRRARVSGSQDAEGFWTTGLYVEADVVEVVLFLRVVMVVVVVVVVVDVLVEADLDETTGASWYIVDL
jgi:hypothetical protein